MTAEDDPAVGLPAEALPAGAAAFRMAQRMLRIGTWCLDMDSGRLDWSDNVFELYGWDKGAFEGTLEAYVAMVHPADREAMWANYSGFVASNSRHFEFAHRIVRPDGRAVHVRGVGERLDTAGGRTLNGVVQDVSEQERAGRELGELTHLQRLAGRVARLGAWRFESDTNRLLWTDETAAIHDETPGMEPDVERAIDYYVPEHRARIRGAFDRCLASGDPFDEVLQLTTARGRLVWVRAIGEAEPDEAGGIRAVQGAFQDITELVETRGRLEAMSRRLRETLENLSDAFFTLDHGWRFTFVNNRAEILLDRRALDLVGKVVWEEFPSAVGSTFQMQYERAVSEQETVRFTEYYEPLEKWFEVTAYPVPEGLAAQFRDVSAERAREEQLRLLEAAVSRVNDILLITDAEPIDEPDGPKIVYVNDAFARLTGYSREEVIGRTPRLLQGPQTDRAELDRIRHALQRRQPCRAELVNYTRSGEPYRLELDIVPISDDTGRYTHFVAVERDVTERRQLDERLRQSQKLEAVGQLTGGVAHDFNNLLTVILGNAELLEEGLAQQPQLLPLAKLVGSAAERGAELTNRLLAFGRRQALQPRIIDLTELVAGMDGLIRRTLPESIDLQVMRSGELWLAEVDPGQLEVALLNLVINARDAMPEGGRLTIETGNAFFDDAYAAHNPDVVPGQYVMVCVFDNGEGMPPEVIERAFEPFFTTKEVGKGGGLGLSMVYGFVKQSGGHAKIYSEIGQGTAVRLYLPRASATAEPPVPPAPPVATLPGGSESILVVEDDDLVREHLEGQLEDLGYGVVGARTGAEALAVLHSGVPVDLLFTDVVMPGGMNGRELADQSLALRPSLKILFTSGYSESALVHNGRLDRGIHLLSKPYRRQELARKVRQALEGA